MSPSSHPLSPPPAPRPSRASRPCQGASPHPFAQKLSLVIQALRPLVAGASRPCASGLSRSSLLLLILSTCPVDAYATAPTSQPATTSITLPDPARKKNLTLFITLPTTPTPAHLILLSPGSAPADKLQPLMQSLAAQGYTSLTPAITENPNDSPTQQLLSRTQDLALILRSQSQIESNLPTHPHLDFTRIAALGEGPGCPPLLLLAGLRPPWLDKSANLTTPTIKLLILTNPDTPTIPLDPAALQPLTLPILLTTAQPPPPYRDFAPRRKLFDALPPTDKYFLTLAGQTSLTPGPERLPAGAAVLPAHRAILATFLEAYLPEQPTPAKDLMISGSVIAPFRTLANLESK